MSQQVRDAGATLHARSLVLLPTPRGAGSSHRARLAAGSTGSLDGADRLARREAVLHLLELDRQRRRHRSA